MLGIIIPKLIIVNIGSEANGLVSSVNQIYVYVNLLEAGVGVATLQALYHPVGMGNKAEINAIISATKHYYDRISIYYACAVMLLSIIYPLVIHSAIDFSTVFLVVLLTGFSGVVNFRFQAKFKILLQAEGKNYLITNLTTITNVATSLAKAVLISVTRNLVIIQFVYCGISLFQMAFYTYYERKHYDWIDYSVKPDYKAIEKKDAAIVHQISGLIFNNTDILLLSCFCDLTVVSIYTLYNLIIGVVNTVLNVINGSVLFILGQDYRQNRERFYKEYSVYETIFLMILFIAYGVLIACIIPFLKLYTKGMTDANYIDVTMISLFVLVQLLSGIKIPGGNIINIAGHFKETKNRSIIESVINLSVSLAMVMFFGAYGVLLGTIAALLYRSNDIIWYSRKVILKSSPLKTYKKIMPNLVIIVLEIVYFSKQTIICDTYFSLLGYAVICGTIISALVSLVNLLMNFSDFRALLSFRKKA